MPACHNLLSESPVVAWHQAATKYKIASNPRSKGHSWPDSFQFKISHLKSGCRVAALPATVLHVKLTITVSNPKSELIQPLSNMNLSISIWLGFNGLVLCSWYWCWILWIYFSGAGRRLYSIHSEVILLLLHRQVNNKEYLGRAKLKENRRWWRNHILCKWSFNFPPFFLICE